GLVGSTLGGVQSSGLAPHPLESVRSEHQLRTVEKERTKERMIAINGGGARRALLLFHEWMETELPSDHAVGQRPTQERVGERKREIRQERSLQENVLDLGIDPLEDLRGDVIEDVLRRGVRSSARAAGAHRFQQQHEPGDPPTGDAMNVADRMFP